MVDPSISWVGEFGIINSLKCRTSYADDVGQIAKLSKAGVVTCSLVAPIELPNLNFVSHLSPG